MKQLNQIWQHHTTALVIQIQHIFSISAIINPLLDTGLPVCYIFCSIWLVCTPAVLDYLPGSVSLQFCLVSSAGIPRLGKHSRTVFINLSSFLLVTLSYIAVATLDLLVCYCTLPSNPLVLLLKY